MDKVWKGLAVVVCLALIAVILGVAVNHFFGPKTECDYETPLGKKGTLKIGQSLEFMGYTYTCGEGGKLEDPVPTIDDGGLTEEPTIDDGDTGTTGEGECEEIPSYYRPPQPQVGHPSFYIETGVNPLQLCWTGEVLEGFVGIVGGFTVDGTSGGVYRAIPPGSFKVRVTDGFLAIAVDEMAREEFCFRVGQAAKYGWARGTVKPLVGWSACKAVKVAGAQATGGKGEKPSPQGQAERRTTGQDQTLSFKKGDSVLGWKIVLRNGEECDGGGCYLPKAPTKGDVTSGVINPWPKEVENISPWNPG